MKYSRALALILALIVVSTCPAAAAPWLPPDGDAVLRGIADDPNIYGTGPVKLIRVLPVVPAGGVPLAVSFAGMTQPVILDGDSVTVSVGSIEVGTSVAVNNFPAVQTVAFADTQPVSLTDLAEILNPLATIIGLVDGVEGYLDAISGGLPSLAANVAAIKTQLATGSVAVTGLVNVGNFPAAQAVTGDFYPPTQPVSGTVDIGNLPAVQTVEGSVEVLNFPAIQPVSGTVDVGNFPAVQTVGGTVGVAGSVSVDLAGQMVRTTVEAIAPVTIANLPATQTVDGTVNVGNLPAVQNVAVLGTVPVEIVDLPIEVVVGTVEVMPSVEVSNLPAVQTVAGTVNVGNLPATQPVSVADPVAVTGDFYPVTQPVSGTVAVSNLPATQTVEGTVAVSNMPTEIEVKPKAGAPLDVTGNFYPATQTVDGTVNVGNWPAAQAVTGDFYPPTQPVSGSVSVSNLPAVQTVDFNATQEVKVDDEIPVRVEAPNGVAVTSLPAISGTVAVSNLPATQPVSIADPIAVAGTVPVVIDPISPAPVYAAATLPVLVTNPEPVRQRWSEVVAPTFVNGTAYTFVLEHEPVEWTLEGLSDTLPIYLEKGGPPATTASYKIRPGKAITRTDGGKIFSIYAEADANPASFQLYSVYEVVIGY